MLFPPTRKPRRVLRPYQVNAISQAVAAIWNRPILVSPTGSGKTVMGTEIVKELDVPTLWLAHRTELIDQAATSLRDNGLHVGIIKAGRDADSTAQVQVASIQSLIRRDKPDASLIVIDEAHHATASTYRTILDAYPSACVLGLTATPFRTDGRGLGDIFQNIIVSAYTDELVQAGFLHAPKVYASAPPDLRGVKITAGDYNLAQLSARMTDDSVREIVAEWQKRSTGRATVAFAVDVEHSKAIAAAFNAAGIVAEHLDGTTEPEIRRSMLDRLRTRQTMVVSNVDVWTEGTDLPFLETAIIARPTASLCKHLQIIGRIMRTCEGKTTAIVLDHAGNHHQHGLVTRRIKYSLADNDKVGSADPLGLRQCLACFVLYESSLSACPECGHVPTPNQRARTDGVIGGPLSEFVEDFEYRRRIWNLIESERLANCYKPGWSLFRYEERFGHKPIIADIGENRELIDPDNATMQEKEAVYRGFMAIVNERGLKPGFASHKYKEIFGCWPKGFVANVRDDRQELAERWRRITT